MFIQTYHPKKSVRPDKATIQRVLGTGWIAQAKMNGWRCQIHITETGVVNFTRKGTRHTRPLPKAIIEQLKELFAPGTAVVGEWVHHEQRLYLFDYIKKDGEVLNRMTYEERHRLLPLCAGAVSLLPIITDLDLAFETLMDQQTEGLVFKSITTKGFSNDSIIRCRRNGIQFKPERIRK